MIVTRSFRSSWGICWSGAAKRRDPGGPLAGHIGVVVVLHRIGQVVTTALAECAAELPVAFELHERGMLVVHADVPRPSRTGTRRSSECAEEITRLDEPES